jgi:hypothetical protein
VLIALLIAYFASSSGGALTSPLLGDPAKLKEAIRHQVKDPARLTQLESLTAEAKSADQEAKARQAKAFEALGASAARQASTPEELEASVEALMAARRASRDRDLALRLRLAALTTPEEWTAVVAEVFPAPPKEKAP